MAKKQRAKKTKARPSEQAGAGSDVADRIRELIASRGPVRSPEVASALGIDVTAVRDALTALEASGVLVRTGQTRGTRWHLADGAPAAAGTNATRPKVAKKGRARAVRPVKVERAAAGRSRSRGEAPAKGVDVAEQLGDLLAERDGSKSHELAASLGISQVLIREELVNLEKLGIVYRTGSTRGTRWWLG